MARTAAPTGRRSQSGSRIVTKRRRYFESGDKVAAVKANAEALSLSPSDPRGLKQQADIAAMPDVVPPPVAPVPDEPDVAPPVAAVPTAGAVTPSVASTLRVAPRPGETAAQRADREKRARTGLDEGRAALEDRRYGVAIGLLQAAMRESGRQDFGESRRGDDPPPGRPAATGLHRRRPET